MTDRYGAARGANRGDDALPQVALAAVVGRVDVLLLERDRQVEGSMDPGTGVLQIADTVDAPAAGDVLDDLAEAVLRNGGEVIIVPPRADAERHRARCHLSVLGIPGQLGIHVPWDGSRTGVRCSPRLRGRCSIRPTFPRSTRSSKTSRRSSPATLFVALGVNMYAHAGLLTGGTAGLAFLVHYATGWRFGVVFFVINLPFVWFAIRTMGWRFTLKTFVAVALLSVFVGTDAGTWCASTGCSPPMRP